MQIESQRIAETEQESDSAHKVDLLCADMIEQVRQTSRNWLDRSKIVAVLGGDHSTPLGLLQALSEDTHILWPLADRCPYGSESGL